MTTEPYVKDIYDAFRAPPFYGDINYGAQETIEMIKFALAQLSKTYDVNSIKSNFRELAFDKLKEVLVSKKRSFEAVPYYLSIIHYLNT